MIGLTIDAIEVGDGAEITRRASDADIAGFVESVEEHVPFLLRKADRLDDYRRQR